MLLVSWVLDHFGEKRGKILFCIQKFHSNTQHHGCCRPPKLSAQWLTSLKVLFIFRGRNLNVATSLLQLLCFALAFFKKPVEADHTFFPAGAKMSEIFH